VQIEPVYKKSQIFNTSASRGVQYAPPADAYAFHPFSNATFATLLKQPRLNQKVLGTRCLNIFRFDCYLPVVLKDIVMLNLFVPVVQQL
jgi:hypothetical protein